MSGKNKANVKRLEGGERLIAALEAAAKPDPEQETF